jgi:hypothetical protein
LRLEVGLLQSLETASFTRFMSAVVASLGVIKLDAVGNATDGARRPVSQSVSESRHDNPIEHANMPGVGKALRKRKSLHVLFESNLLGKLDKIRLALTPEPSVRIRHGGGVAVGDSKA